MNDFYAEMADVATELLTEFKQGVVTLTRVTHGEADPATPWIPGGTTEQAYDLNATVAAVTVDQANAQYIDGTTITNADVVVTCAVPPVVPTLTDTLSIDGKVRIIKKIVQVPAAGIPIVFKLFVQG